MTYCFDLDGTICTTDEKKDYKNCKLIPGMKEKINKLYEKNYIKIFTARGASSGIDWTDLTKKQLDLWGIKYHELILNQKPSYDIFIDDKAINAKEWRKKNLKQKTGIIAGSFDVIHPGYIEMFKEAKDVCTHLTIALQGDPTIERPQKLKPILSIEERKNILLSIKYIDEVLVYNIEKELENILKNNSYNVRILGSDYLGKFFTGYTLTDEVYYVSRNHGWSTTDYKRKIYLNFGEKNAFKF